MDLDKLTKELLDKKANENNTIDLNAYAMGMADLKKQLALCNVSCGLPSKEAVTLEAYKKSEEMKKQNDKADKFAYSCGYIDGYEKCKSLFETD